MRYQEIKSLSENQELDEVRMGSSDLQKFLQTPLAQSMTSGFEAELIFEDGNESSNDYNYDDYEPDYQPDYNADERVDDIDDIISFFQSGDWATLEGSQAISLREEMLNDYREWRDEKLRDNFIDKSEELIKDWIEGDDWDWNSKIEEYLRDEMDLSDREVEAAMTAGHMWSPKIESSKQSAEIRKKDKNFDNYVNASDEINDQLDHRVEEAVNDHNDDWNSAYDNFVESANDDDDYNQTDWLRAHRIINASDVQSHYEDLNWPHFNDDNEYNVRSSGGDGKYNMNYAKILAASFEKEFGVKTQVESGTRTNDEKRETPPGIWIFEADGSLNTGKTVNDPVDEDMPIEIVSPRPNTDGQPMHPNLPEIIEMLPKFFNWAKNNKAYANESTGLHMSIGLPNHVADNIDFTKLALFLGDEYVLESFNRSAEDYCISAISKIKDVSKTADITKLFEQMRNHLSQLASKSLAQPSGFGKYTSIHPKDKYIEFRSAGGMNYFKDIDKIKNTLLRYAYATAISSEPKLERNEYAKKLFRLLTNVNLEHERSDTTFGPPQTLYSKRIKVKQNINTDIIALFSNYMAGNMPISALKSFLKQNQFKREVQKNKYIDKKMWWNVNLGNHSIELVATSEQEAKNKAALEWRIRDQRGMIARPIRPYEEQPVSEPSRGSNTGPVDYVIRQRAGNQSGQGPALYRFSAESARDAVEKARQWADSQGQPRLNFWLQKADELPPELSNVAPQRRQSIPEVPIDVAQNFR
jgi:hypothetical protein